MLTLSSSPHSEKLENVKKEIKCLLIANSRERTTLEQLPKLFESLLGECIPFQDFNFYSLKDFLSSIPDAVSLSFDKTTNQTYIYPVESSNTEHISSLVARQRKTKGKKLKLKPKLLSNYIDPILLKKLMLKLSIDKCIKKADLLTEIQAAIGVYSLYSIGDLNTQLNELNHILTHDESSVYLKSNHLLQHCSGFVKQKTKDYLYQLLTEKYPEGIWCEQLPDVYRKEYGINLEYRDLGFNDILEFIAAVYPSHTFTCSRPPNTTKYRVARADMPLRSSLAAQHLECDIERTAAAAPLPIHRASLEVSRRLIPEGFMNFDDCIEQISVDTVLDNSDVIVSEICNPDLFWIILHRNKHKLIRLMDNLQEFYQDDQEQLDEYKIPPIVLQPGLHVACLYSKQWHRARIINNDENFNYTVKFYDYGTTKVYDASNLYFLHKKFGTLPAQAIPCCLYNIEPTNCKKWTRVAVEKFTDKTIEQNFVALIHKRNQQDNSIAVSLIDAVVDMNISQWMVSNNLAKWGSNNNNNNNKKKINVNKISSSQADDQQQHYIRPSKQLEALQKYRTRLKVVQQHSAIVTEKSITEALTELEKLIKKL